MSAIQDAIAIANDMTPQQRYDAAEEVSHRAYEGDHEYPSNYTLRQCGTPDILLYQAYYFANPETHYEWLAYTAVCAPAITEAECYELYNAAHNYTVTIS